MALAKKSRKRTFYVYLLEMKNGKIYVGYTSDLERRYEEHSAGKGARTTRVFGVSRLLYSETLKTRRAAMKREYQIKTWPRQKKLALVSTSIPSQAP